MASSTLHVIEPESDLAMDLDRDAPVVYDLTKLTSRITGWTKRLREAIALVQVPGPTSEPFKNVYSAIEGIALLNFEVDTVSNVPSVLVDPVLKFWVRFTKIHILSCLAKWHEIGEELSLAELHHVQCLELIEKELPSSSNTEITENLLNDLTLTSANSALKGEDEVNEELNRGKGRVQYMYIYELTRYAILCSERDNQEKALDLLKKAEAFYHENNVSMNESNLPPLEPSSLLGLLNSLNPESSTDLFIYLLFYLGQAYKIKGDNKERAILYLHMVLRLQIEKGDCNNIQWGSDASQMASVLMVNAQAFGTARDILVAATTVIKRTPVEEQDSDNFKQNWANLGRTWGKFGVNLLEYSADRLKDLQDEASERKQLKFESKIKLDKYEKQSLGLINGDDAQTEYDTVLLLRGLKFPTLDVSEVNEVEMKGRFARDFDEARSIFLPCQKWINIAKAYYNLDEYATDYIDIVTDYAALFKHLSFFEPGFIRQIKMHKRRITMLEELLGALNPKVYTDVFHVQLRELAETYEKIYKLKVEELKDRGKSLRPKDGKLVKYLTDACDAHKRNLVMFGFDIDHPEKSFPEDNEKVMMAFVLSIARVKGSICHDHPLHGDAISLGEESKRYYQYFLNYLDRRIELRREFFHLYEASIDMPELMDGQIRKIKHHLRMRSAVQSENT